MKFMLLACFVAALSAVQGAELIAKPHLSIPDPRIVGGAEVKPHSAPYQVGLVIDGSGFCGGVLISESLVLTSASCVQHAKTVEAVLGAHNINEGEKSQVRVDAGEIIVNEQWNPELIIYDAALLKLSSPVKLSDDIKPVSLPDPDDKFSYKRLLVTGWGKESDASNSLSPVLKGASLRVITNEVCKQSYPGVYFVNICVKADNGIEGACAGDAGGPAVDIEKGVLAGIVSYGSSKGCEANSPTVLTRVTSLLDWISEHK
ncbi:PREDICTED: chymotrypsin BII-like [Nicrophorus vespilloides]|uniref:Chymotrypsin BII-like n=1 Tax=Nicrophorus vespilloides TaxID=110193 RepID=A0ABM1N9H1_NICVS|nr:PREDICTED: chymotrypsin BII-like [Nicrophorus vespilloides]